MDKQVEKSGDKTVISLSGQLIETDRLEFSGMISNVFASGAKDIELNMAGLSYMDSIGLGLLVTLRDEAEKNDAVVRITGPQGKVKELLEMARFDILFEIS